MTRLSFAILVCVVALGAACTPSRPTHTRFVVEGMHCDSCSAAITDALQKTHGVLSASADHEHGTADAVHTVKNVSAEQLAETIEGLGYTVTEIQSANDS